MTTKQVHLSGNNPVCPENRKGSFEDLFKIEYKSPWGKFGKYPQDRSEQEQRERLQRFQASGGDAPAPVQIMRGREYERY